MKLARVSVGVSPPTRTGPRAPLTTAPPQQRNGVDLDDEIAALRTAVEEELNGARSIYPWPVEPDHTTRARPRRGPRRVLRRLRRRSRVLGPYIGAIALGLLLGLLAVHITGSL
jgi:hypothetical protein